MPSVDDKFQFFCKICFKPRKSSFQHVPNLIKHLEEHDELKEWIKAYREFLKHHEKQYLIDEPTFRFVRFFTDCDPSFEMLNKQSFTDIVDPKIKIESYHTITNRLLPEVMEKLHKKFAEKLRLAVTVSLMVDLWSKKKKRSSYIALVAAIMNTLASENY